MKGPAFAKPFIIIRGEKYKKKKVTLFFDSTGSNAADDVL